MKVLIIDSSIQIVTRLQEMLFQAMTSNCTYYSGNYGNGFQVFKETSPDVVLMGVGLPENDSVKLLGEIKKENFSTPVIMLTVNTNEYILAQCKLLGADHFLDKYYDFEKISSIINTVPSQQ